MGPQDAVNHAIEFYSAKFQLLQDQIDLELLHQIKVGTLFDHFDPQYVFPGAYSYLTSWVPEFLIRSPSMPAAGPLEFEGAYALQWISR